MKKQGFYFMTREQTEKVQNIIFKPGTHNMNSKFVGHRAEVIAAAAGFSVPEGTCILVGEQDGVGPDYPLSYEKLTQVIAFYTVYNWKEAHDLCNRLLQHGLGHTFSIHTEDKDMVMKFSDMPVCRIMVNSPSTQGGVGGCNNLLISYTLGAGTIGGSAVSENVGPQNFINKKVIAWATVDLSDLKAIDPTWDYDPEPEAPAADAFANAFNSAASSGITQDQLNEIVNLMVKSLKGEK